MALVRGNNYFIGKGEAASAPVVNGTISGALLLMGNCSSMTIALETEKKPVKNYKTVGGGNDFSLERITGITGAMTVYEWTLDNLKIGLRALGTDYATGTVTDESHANVFAGSLIELKYAADLAVEPVVKRLRARSLRKALIT